MKAVLRVLRAFAIAMMQLEVAPAILAEALPLTTHFELFASFTTRGRSATQTTHRGQDAAADTRRTSPPPRNQRDSRDP